MLVKYKLFGIGYIKKNIIFDYFKVNRKKWKIKYILKNKKYRAYIYNNLLVGENLNQNIFKNLRRKVIAQSVSGIRFKKHLPIHWQRTKSNAKTSKKLNNFNRYKTNE